MNDSIDVMGPYAWPTSKASRELVKRLKTPWSVPFPLNKTEEADFLEFLKRKNVNVRETAPLFGEFEADRDLCPYVFAWRYLRGELTFTALGRAQYAGKEPFETREP